MPAPVLDVAKPVLLPVGRDLVRRAMQARGLSVTALAAKLGISRKHLSNVLNGHAPPSVALLRALGDASGVDAVLLFDLLERGPGPEPARYGAMKGTIEVLGDPTEPMEGWEMLEESQTETAGTEWRERISIDPAVCHGRACIRGTRIPVAVVLDSLAAGLSPEEIVASYPPLRVEDVRAATAYAAELARERFVEIVDHGAA